MKKLFKFLTYTVIVLLLVAVCFYGFAYYKTEQGLALRYDVQDAPLQLPQDMASLAYGARLFV